MGRKWQCYFRINIPPAINVDGGSCWKWTSSSSCTKILGKCFVHQGFLSEFLLVSFQWLSTNHTISGRGDSNLVEDPLGKITIVFCGSVVVLKDCNLDDLVFRHPKPWALQHVAPRRRWGGNCQLEDVSLVFFFKVLGKWIHFWMFKCWGRNQRPYCLKGPDEVGLCQTLSDFVCWIQSAEKHLSPKMDRPFWLGNRDAWLPCRALLDWMQITCTIIAFLRSV